MIGIDIVEISRIKKLMGEKFYSRVFTQEEVNYLASKNYAPQTAAGLFCAKEAVLKALGCGIGNGANLKQVEIVHDTLGRPTVNLRGKAQELALQLGGYLCVSISHTSLTAIAVAQVIFKEQTFKL